MIEELYWQDNEYIKWKLEFLQNNTFSNSDIEALYYKGLPEWAAPNMYFFHSSKTNNGELIIGEDRNDRKIYIDVASKQVYSGEDRLFVNSNVSLFRKALQIYALMIEAAIAKDANAFIDSKIENELVHKFECQLLSLDSKSLQRGYFLATRNKQNKSKRW